MHSALFLCFCACLQLTACSQNKRGLPLQWNALERTQRLSSPTLSSGRWGPPASQSICAAEKSLQCLLQSNHVCWKKQRSPPPPPPAHGLCPFDAEVGVVGIFFKEWGCFYSKEPCWLGLIDFAVQNRPRVGQRLFLKEFHHFPLNCQSLPFSPKTCIFHPLYPGPRLPHFTCSFVVV